MRKFNLFLSLLLLISQLGFSQLQLNTVPPLNGGNGNQGITFNVKATQTVRIDSFYCTFSGQGNTDVWYNESAINGLPNINSTNGWLVIDTANVTQNTNGDGSISPIPMAINVTIPAGSTYGFFINGNLGAPVRYTDGTVGVNASTSDNNITIETGANVGYGGAFPTPAFTPRQFNGGVIYSVIRATNDASVTSVDSPIVFCEGVQNVFATISNQGINQLDSVDINWELNNVAQPTFSFIGLLDTLNGNGTSDTILDIGSAMFLAGSNQIKVYTSNPNGIADTTNYNDTVYIDVKTASIPINPFVSNIGTNSVELFLESFANSFDYQYGLSGFTIGNGTLGSSTVVPLLLNGLQSGTAYDVYFRSNCGMNDTSLWIGPVSFTTAYTVPFVQDFEGFNADISSNPWPFGWSSTTSTDPRWESEDADGTNENSFETGPLYDHTTFGVSGGNYIYMEASGGDFGDSATFISPPVFVETNQTTVKLSYWYFNHGADIQRMEVIIDTNGVEEVIASYVGEQQKSQDDEWLKASHFLKDYNGGNITLKYRGFNSFGITDDVAIDDIKIDTLPTLDVALESILNPVGNICPISTAPKVVVRNEGLTTITSLNLVVNVNGTSDTNTFITNILSGDTAHLTLSSVTFNSGVFYDVSIYSINPNGIADPIPQNDSIVLNDLATGIEGTITIDPSLTASASNYVSFASLQSQLEATGVCGNVTVNVAPGTYTETLTLERIAGLSASSRLTINGGDSNLVTLRNNTSASPAVISIIRSSYITIKNMTLIGNYSGSSTEFGVFYSGSNYDSLINCKVEMNPTATGDVIGVAASADIENEFAEGNNSNFTVIMNCNIKGGGESIHFEGGAGANWNTGNQFISNRMTAMYDNGIYLDEQDSVSILNNSITGMRSSFGKGITLLEGMNFDISGNHVIAEDYGVYVRDANANKDADDFALVSNNMITSYDQRAIYLTNPHKIKVYHNSVYSEGDVPAVELLTGGFIDSLDIRNNIFFSKNNLALQVNNPDTMVFLRFDNNSYYSRGPLLLNIESVDYSNLAAYKGVRARFNVNSLEGDPQYTSAEDLHILGNFVDDKADNSVLISVDIDGETRPSPNGTNKDIGADEFDPPSCSPPIYLRVANVRADSALIRFSPSIIGNPVIYEIGLTGFTLGTGETGIISTDSIRLNDLLELTTYEVYVKEICGRGDTSTYAGPIEFETACLPLSANYFNDLEDEVLDAVPSCWFEYSTYPGGYVEVDDLTGNGSPFSGTQALYLYSSSGFTTGFDTLLTITNRLNEVRTGNKRIRFMASTSNTANAMVIATANSQDGKANFTPLDTIIFSATNSYEEYIVDLATANNYNGTDEFVAFSHSLSTTFDYLRIDDFYYENIPTCLKPNNITAGVISSDSALLKWNEKGTASQWQVQYSLAPFSISTAVDTFVTNDTLGLGRLLDRSDYEYRIRAICTSGDSSFWSNIRSFKTPCVSYPVPFEEGFANYVPVCWEEAGSGTPLLGPSDVGQSLWDTGDYLNSASNGDGVTINLYTNNREDWILTPPVDLSSTTGPHELVISVGVTDWQGTTAANMGSDDRVEVLSSIDGGITWVNLFTFNNTNKPVETGDVYTVTLTGYNHPGTLFAIWASDGFVDDTEDYDFHVGNFLVREIPSCPAPQSIVTSIISSDTASISWIEKGVATQWEVIWDTSGFVIGTERNRKIVATNASTTLSGLMGETSYDWYVRAICSVSDTSLYSTLKTFTTLCPAYSLPFNEDFTTYVPDCWEEAGSGAPSTGPSDLGTSLWGSANYLNAVANGRGVKINLYTDNREDWILSPAIDLSATTGPHELVINVGVTDWQGTGPDNMGSDDRVEILSSVDGGATWINLETFDINNQPTETGETYTIPLIGYSNANTLFAIWATDGIVDDIEDYDFHIGNFEVRELPSCLGTQSMLASGVSSDTAIISWTEVGSANQWEVIWDTTGFVIGTERNSLIVNTDTFTTLTALEGNTRYDWYVRAICGVMDTSLYSSLISFTTLCPVYSLPFEEDFITYVPDCWDEAGSGSPSLGASDLGGSLWSSGNYLNAASNGRGVKINLYTDNREDWILSPAVDLSSTVGPHELVINVGVTDWQGTGPDDMGSDDKVEILSSIDGGATWVNLETFDINNQPPETGETYFIPLTGYNNPITYFAIWATDGTINDLEDYDFHVGNFEVREVPTCFEPQSNQVLTVTADTVDVSWIENGTATEWEVIWDTTGFVIGAERNSLIINVDTFATLKSLISNTDYDWYVRAICRVGDSSNWSSTKTFKTPCSSFSIPLIEEFSTYVPDCWDEAGSGTPSTGPSDLGESVWISDDYLNEALNGDGVRINLYTTNREDWILSPAVDLSATTGPFELVINVGVTDWLGTGPDDMGSDDRVEVLSSIDGGATWVNLETFDSSNEPSELGEEYIIPLTGYNNANTLFAIWATDGVVDDVEDYDFHVGRFEVRDVPTCPAPIVEAPSSISGNSVQINWTERGVASRWQVVWDTSGFTLGSQRNTAIVNVDTFKTIGSLTETTIYDYYVRAICGRNDTSFWTKVETFITPCLTYSAPYFEDFENAGQMPDCIEQGANNSEDWLFATTGGHVGNNGAIAGSTTSGNYFAYVDDSDPHNANTSLLTPLVDLRGVNNPTLEFYRLSDNEGVTNGNVDFTVEIFDGVAWNQVYFSDTNSVDEAWELISIPLTNLAITGPVRARFTVDENNGFNFEDDVAIDDIYIGDRLEADAGATKVISPLSLSGNDSCSLGNNEIVSIEIENFGTGIIDSIEVAYIFNGALLPVREMFRNLNLASNTKDTVTFSTSVNISINGTYVIDAFTALTGDGDVLNDSTLSTIVNEGNAGIIFGEDTICGSDSLLLSLGNSIGSVQWQQLVGSTWTDIVGANAISTKFRINTITDFRAVTCGSLISDTFTVVPLRTAGPTVIKNDNVVVGCGISGTDTLVAESSVVGTKLIWYADSVGNNVIERGDTLLFIGNPSLSSNSVSDTFYVASGGGTENVGAVDNNIGTGGNFTNVGGQELYFDVNTDAVLKSVFLYPNIAGDVEIELRDVNGIVLESRIVTVSNTGGERVSLDFDMTTGSYELGANGSGTTTGGLYRNSTGGSYPYTTSDGSVSITGNSFGPAYYYFFYDWEVQSGCESSRTMVIGNVDCLVGIEDHESLTDVLKVYPNPSSGIFTLDVTNNGRRNYWLEVNNLNGKVVFEKNIAVDGNYKEQLDFASFAKGVYFLQIQTENSTELKKLVIH